MVGLAVNVGRSLVQTEVEGVVTVTEGATVDVTVIVIVFELDTCAHEMLGVMMHTT